MDTAAIGLVVEVDNMYTQTPYLDWHWLIVALWLWPSPLHIPIFSFIKSTSTSTGGRELCFGMQRRWGKNPRRGNGRLDDTVPSAAFVDHAGDWIWSPYHRWIGARGVSGVARVVGLAVEPIWLALPPLLLLLQQRDGACELTAVCDISCFVLCVDW